jgi:hypothetical protein
VVDAAPHETPVGGPVKDIIIQPKPMAHAAPAWGEGDTWGAADEDDAEEHFHRRRDPKQAQRQATQQPASDPNLPLCKQPIRSVKVEPSRLDQPLAERKRKGGGGGSGIGGGAGGGGGQHEVRGPRCGEPLREQRDIDRSGQRGERGGGGGGGGGARDDDARGRVGGGGGGGGGRAVGQHPHSREEYGGAPARDARVFRVRVETLHTVSGPRRHGGEQMEMQRPVHAEGPPLRARARLSPSPPQQRERGGAMYRDEAPPPPARLMYRDEAPPPPARLRGGGGAMYRDDYGPPQLERPMLQQQRGEYAAYWAGDRSRYWLQL